MVPVFRFPPIRIYAMTSVVLVDQKTKTIKVLAVLFWLTKNKIKSASLTKLKVN